MLVRLLPLIILIQSLLGAQTIKQLSYSIGEYNYQAEIRNDSVFINKVIPFSQNQLKIKRVKLGKGFRSDYKKNSFLPIQNGFNHLVITNKVGKSLTIPLFLKKDRKGSLLFENNESKVCRNTENRKTKGALIFGKYRVINNDWGYYKIKKGRYEQCISIYQDKNDTIFGWYWNMPKKAYGVISYPEINYRLPSIPAGEIKTLKSTFDVDLYSERGRYNLAFDLWIFGDKPNGKRDRHTEIMIWEFAEGSKPGGKYKNDVTTSNGTYKFYLGEVFNKRENRGWQYVAFVRKNQRTKGTTDIDELIQYLLDKQIITKDLTVETVELGTEIVSSKGYAVFNNYYVDFKTKR